MAIDVKYIGGPFALVVSIHSYLCGICCIFFIRHVEILVKPKQTLSWKNCLQFSPGSIYASGP